MSADRLVHFLIGHVRAVAVAVMVVTAAIVVPFLGMQPTSTASPEPDGPVFDARDRIDERFETQVFTTFTVIEAEQGNVLDPDVLRDLADAEEALRADDVVGPLLWTAFDRDLQAPIDGIRTLADGVSEALVAQGTTLESASDEQVSAVVDQIIDQVGPVAVGLSQDASADREGTWSAEALTAAVLADNQALGGGSNAITIGTDDTTKETFARDVVDALQAGADTYTVFGVAADANLTAAEEGERAGPFIGLTIAAVLVIVGFTFRSYWSVAVIGGALAILIVWLRGLSNLVGLEADQVLDTIVPIALISFGVDFAFHALGRIREEQSATEPRGAVRAVLVGLVAVLGALGLALASDTAAFLSNAAAGIESIVQFGVAASIGLTSAFVLLGVIAPVVITHLEGLSSGGGRRWVTVLASGTAISTVTAAVLLSVFVLPAVGVGILAAYLVGFIAVPWLVLERRGGPAAEPARPVRASGTVLDRLSVVLGHLSASAGARPWVVLPVTAVVTVVLGFFALQIPTEFDVRDFFSDDTDFVIGLDKLDEHVGDQGGEPGQVLVEGPLDTVAGLQAVADFQSTVEGLDTPRLARDAAGQVLFDAGILDVVRAAVAAPPAADLVAETTGVAVTDEDGDGLPDSDVQVAALLDFATSDGVPFDGEALSYSAADVREIFDGAAEGLPAATIVTVELPGSRANENVVAAGEVLADPVAQLASEMGALDERGSATLTGSPFVRSGGLDAITRSLLISLPIAILACFVIGAAFMRSVRYGLVAVTPILLVVAWLYGVMELTGFAINLVTGTIGAVSIGIGIDFAIHYIMRFREELVQPGENPAGSESGDSAQATIRSEELEVQPDPTAALRATGEGTGVALVTSAASSIVGFAILAFAPMPLFASYGLLTAVMIAMALTATLLVLPPLLLLAAPERVEPTRAAGSTVELTDPADPAADLAGVGGPPTPQEG